MHRDNSKASLSVALQPCRPCRTVAVAARLPRRATTARISRAIAEESCHSQASASF
jgi:hypothetical protein